MKSLLKINSNGLGSMHLGAKEQPKLGLTVACDARRESTTNGRRVSFWRSSRVLSHQLRIEQRPRMVKKLKRPQRWQLSKLPR
jgi:hypothetical protein